MALDYLSAERSHSHRTSNAVSVSDVATHHQARRYPPTPTWEPKPRNPSKWLFAGRCKLVPTCFHTCAGLVYNRIMNTRNVPNSLLNSVVVAVVVTGVHEGRLLLDAGRLVRASGRPSERAVAGGDAPPSTRPLNLTTCSSSTATPRPSCTVSPSRASFQSNICIRVVEVTRNYPGFSTKQERAENKVLPHCMPSNAPSKCMIPQVKASSLSSCHSAEIHLDH